jgi:HNH endonuclease
MISIARESIDADLTARLAERTSNLQADKADAKLARTRWSSARRERSDLRGYLTEMAPGVERCMYCGDNLGTDIDHFEPISRAPVKTFDWLNHLLACSFCNSNQKRSEYPCDEDGNGLLIDPTSEDPAVHLQLILPTGKYRALTVKGEATICVFGLNRGDLVRGRYNAFQSRGAVLCYAYMLVTQNREDESWRRLSALREEPHASVLNAMIHIMDKGGAEETLGSDVMNALQEPRIRRMLDITY